MTRPNYDLIRFVRDLYDLNSDLYGLSSQVQRDRIDRWMDAVLPPPVEISDEALPQELTKAAE
jgi:hypothetical protein